MSMTIQALFEELSFGPLSNLAMSNEGSGEIVAASRSKLITYTNEALIELYSRFVLNEKEVYIRMVDGITNYYLLKRFSRFAHQNDLNNTDPLYIEDLHNPFEEDVIKVTEVNTSDRITLPLNDNEQQFSVFTPKTYLLQVPTIISCTAISVAYQAKHKKLNKDDISQEIILPEVLHKALNSYVAYKVYSHMNGTENAAKGQEHLAMYESCCMNVEQNDLVNNSISTSNTVFHKRGWI